MKDICCIGHVTLDKIVTPNQTFYQNGGTVFYIGCGLNVLPRRISYQIVTAIAQKDSEVIEKMRADGIEVMNFGSKETVFFENIYGANKNERTQRVMAKSNPFTAAQMEGLQPARIYHLGTLLSDDFSPEAVAELAKKGKISIDIQGYLREVRDQYVYPCDWKEKKEVLAMTDILKLNEYEMEAATGQKDPRQVARTIASWGVREVVLTFGSYGSLIYAGGQFFEIPAFKPRHSIDVTGCGDTFSAGYLYCRAQGMDYKEAGTFAAAMCTLKIEKPGPFSGTIEDIEHVKRVGETLPMSYI